MQALFVTGRRERLLEWREVQPPRMEAPSDAIVSPIAVAACDLDRAIAAGRSPFPGEFMLGHEFTAEVVEIGADVKNVKPGDVVLASFQPSCGICGRCGRGHSSVCEAVPNGGMYGIGETGGGWSGALTDLIRVPWADFNLAAIGEGVDPACVASASDNLADGLRCVEGPLQRRPGGSVLIAGTGSIPLYAVVCAQHLGAGAVTFASSDRFALETAARLGADCLPVESWPSRFKSHDVTVDCTNSVEALGTVIRSTEPYGECTSASIHFGDPIPVPMFNMNMRGISFHTGRVNSASQMSRVLDLVDEGLDPDKIDPAYYPFDAAIEALGTEPLSRKVILKH